MSLPPTVCLTPSTAVIPIVPSPLKVQGEQQVMSEHPPGKVRVGRDFRVWPMELVTVWLGKLSSNKRKIQGYVLRMGRQDPGCLPQP